ncbi:uncharacterized protein LOC111707459 [Eurytemora carolleeae]|uniref:uncharacterized protein LOC111707459 n=1 Tax=Eurytemora carolleeae TaxID=1294199 RepID=UPI000C762C0E|nr:uncharacterized protein LOC111707459 [Eurytemora carolleeae]|eukprot:XP_023336338.1 uncharacterized protein LOC111707459 [Eurytemora affinis]
MFMTELDQVPNSRCSHCLPDCEYTSYKVSLSSAPFRGCSVLNEETSMFCRYSTSLTPSLWADKIIPLYQFVAPLPDYIKKLSEAHNKVLRKTIYGLEYNAYEKDIAILNIYWESDHALQCNKRG